MVEDDRVEEGGDRVEDADVEPVGQEEEEEVDVGEEPLDGEEELFVVFRNPLTISVSYTGHT